MVASITATIVPFIAFAIQICTEISVKHCSLGKYSYMRMLSCRIETKQIGCAATQCLSQDLDFSQKRSYLIFLGSYLQKRGVIHSQRKLRDKARKLRERVRSLYILHAQNTKIVAS